MDKLDIEEKILQPKELSLPEIEDIIVQHNGGSIIDDINGLGGLGIYGPYACGNYRVWEIWVRQKSVFHVRFIHCEQNMATYCNDFHQLCGHLNGEVIRLQNEMEAQKDKRKESFFRLRVAAIVFIIIVSVLSVVILTDKENDEKKWYLFGGLVITAATFFLGTWKNPKG